MTTPTGAAVPVDPEPTPIYDQTTTDLGIDPQQLLADTAHLLTEASTFITERDRATTTPPLPPLTRPLRKVTP